MAIKKSKELNTGVSGDYWKIIKESFDRLTNKATWQIALFKDAEACHDGKAALEMAKLFSAVLDSNEQLENRTQLGYIKIKAQVNAKRALYTSYKQPPTMVFVDPDLAEGEDV